MKMFAQTEIFPDFPGCDAQISYHNFPLVKTLSVGIFIFQKTICG